MNTISTFFGLMAEFGESEIPLEKVAQKYFGIGPAKAKQLASMQQFPVPTYRAGSQKSPWLVSAQALAEHLDKQKQNADREWRKMNE